MSLTLTLTPLPTPVGTPLPGNTTALLTLVSQYTAISGTQNFNGINFGSTTPTADQRGLPWFKTDAFGNPIGLFSWNGTAWVGIPTNLANGPTANRPTNPSVGTEFYDTTIGAVIIYTTSGWSTASGCVGDVKEVKAADLPTALTNNPGWAQDTASIGLVIGGAGGATAITAAHPYGSVVGEENHVLGINEIPAHAHNLASGNNWAAYSGQHQNGTQPAGVYPIVTAQDTAAQTVTAGGGAGHNTLQPTVYYWRLVKQF